MPPTATRTELSILKHLWPEARKSAREMHDAISAETGWSYSTTRTLLRDRKGEG